MGHYRPVEETLSCRSLDPVATTYRANWTAPALRPLLVRLRNPSARALAIPILRLLPYPPVPRPFKPAQMAPVSPQALAWQVFDPSQARRGGREITHPVLKQLWRRDGSNSTKTWSWVMVGFIIAIFLLWYINDSDWRCCRRGTLPDVVSCETSLLRDIERVWLTLKPTIQSE